MSGLTLHYEREAGAGRTWACNMRWCVMRGDREVARGAYWRMRMIMRNGGRW